MLPEGLRGGCMIGGTDDNVDLTGPERVNRRFDTMFGEDIGSTPFRRSQRWESKADRTRTAKSGLRDLHQIRHRGMKEKSRITAPHPIYNCGVLFFVPNGMRPQW